MLFHGRLAAEESSPKKQKKEAKNNSEALLGLCYGSFKMTHTGTTLTQLQSSHSFPDAFLPQQRYTSLTESQV